MSTIRRRRTACGTCVRRKVKCDETHPFCLRCQKGKFVCEGYDPEFVFVEEDPTKKYLSGQRKAPESTPGSSREKKIEAGSSTGAETYPEPRPPVNSVKQTELAVASTLQDTKAPQTPFQDSEIPLLSMTTAGFLTMKDFPQAQERTKLAKAFFVRVQSNPEAKKPNSRRFAEQTLKMLNDRLGDESDPRALDDMPDILAILLYDLILFTESDAWLKHMGALTRIISFHGPKAFMHPMALAFLTILRPLIGLKFVLEKEPCFLSTPEWRTIPWSAQKRPKDVEIELDDLHAFLPSLLAKTKALTTGGSAQERQKKALTLEQEVKDIMVQVFHCRWKWQVENPWAAHSVPIEQSKVTPSWTPFVAVVHMDKPENAGFIESYNTLFINLCIIGQMASSGRFSVRETVIAARESLDLELPQDWGQGLLSVPTEDMTPMKAASEILTLVDYHFEEPHRSEWVFKLIYPLRVAQKILEDNEQIRDWIGEVLSKVTLEDACGFSLATDYFSSASISAPSTCPGDSDDE